MKKGMFWLIGLLLLVVLVTACSAGSTNVQGDIIGEWVSTDGTRTLTFRDDETMSSVYDNGSVSITMSSDTVWLDDTTLLGTWETSMDSWSVKIQGEKMTLKSSHGDKLVMVRP